MARGIREPERVGSITLSEESVWGWDDVFCVEYQHWELTMGFGNVEVSRDLHVNILGSKWADNQIIVDSRGPGRGIVQIQYLPLLKEFTFRRSRDITSLKVNIRSREVFFFKRWKIIYHLIF